MSDFPLLRGLLLTLLFAAATGVAGFSFGLWQKRVARDAATLAYYRGVVARDSLRIVQDENLLRCARFSR